MVPLLVAVIGGYLLGSVPVAVPVAVVHGFDPREVGDRNPGFWNVRQRIGWQAAVPVFVGDTLKGTLAGLLALVVSGLHTTGSGEVSGDSVVPVYLAVAAAMAGHAWPVFAGFRGGRSILTFVGGFAVICPPGFLLGVAAVVAISLAARSFTIGARCGVFGVPLFQSFFAPVEHVAGTCLLMGLIGLRFGQAAWAGRPGRAGRRP
ncbi:glycerol-3-phosphate acyltransferase [Streptosporangium lutulentum]|uniref:Glycerol-3-phosphate acyltransferase n=1 Tax=Streptosporangium lutulentum TaxID=1461250 RepID=A0ABT9Q6P1_9ACTN|nr:glycerol-3-phosphate acyltransferase [Streptosporangium lutulentum]MDP9842414.1 glycerol-3-phosphate acyltransferase PlsY [Streptosporangium lutulentum]